LKNAARLAAHLLGRYPKPLQDIQPHAFILTHETQQQVLGPDVVVPHAAGFFNRQLEDLLRPRSQLDPAAGVPSDAGKTLNHLFYARRIQSEFAKNTASDTTLFSDQAEKEVFGTDVIVVHPLSLFMCQAENSACTLCEALHFVVGHSYLRDRLMLPALACPILPKTCFRPPYRALKAHRPHPRPDGSLDKRDRANTECRPVEENVCV
jgi:hypothetical protein